MKAGKCAYLHQACLFNPVAIETVGALVLASHCSLLEGVREEDAPGDKRVKSSKHEKCLENQRKKTIYNRKQV